MLNTEKFINKSKEKFKAKFNYTKVDYNGSLKNVTITCKIHGDFEIKANNHLRSKDGGCKECQKEKLIDNTFIEKSKKIHNNKYDYSLVKYKNNITKVNIICPIHGVFVQYPKNHLSGHGCAKCDFEKNRKSLEDFILESNKIHNNKYDYSESIYVNSSTKLKIKCPIHGVFEQSPNTHISKKSGCHKCDSNRRRLTVEEFIEKSNKVHNNKYKYTKTIYDNTRSKIIITCPQHGDFEQTPSNHIQGYGCPICNESKGEKEITKILKEKGINYIKQYKFDGCENKKALPFDFYLPDYNMCIEYDGEQHFKPIIYWGGDEKLKYIQNNDKIKNEYCKENNIRLIRIRYNEKNFNKLKFILPHQP